MSQSALPAQERWPHILVCELGHADQGRALVSCGDACAGALARPQAAGRYAAPQLPAGGPTRAGQARGWTVSCHPGHIAKRRMISCRASSKLGHAHEQHMIACKASCHPNDIATHAWSHVWYMHACEQTRCVFHAWKATKCLLCTQTGDNRYRKHAACAVVGGMGTFCCALT